MSVCIQNELFSELIESLHKVIKGDSNVKLKNPDDNREIGVLIETLNDLIKHINGIKNKPEETDKNSNNIKDEIETGAYSKLSNSDGSLRLAKNIMDKANEAIYGLDSFGDIIYANESALRSLELTKGEMAGKMIYDIDPAIKREEWAKHWEDSREKKFSLFESMHKTKSGKIIPVEVAIGFLVFDGKEYHSSFVRDITERKKAEEELKSSLKEKEVLLKELYHRTKNNMQVIRAMLAIKSAYSSDEEVKKNYLDMENRILTMSLVHQKLYQSHNLSSIDLKEYFEDLVQLLMKSYNASEERIKVSMHLEKTFALIDTAIPCGLIFNELLSNSLKHGFPDNREGEIKISLSGSNSKTIELFYSDNGVGLPEDFNFRGQNSLGIQSIFTIAEHQLQGKASFKVNNGIECHIQMNNSLYLPRV